MIKHELTKTLTSLKILNSSSEEMEDLDSLIDSLVGPVIPTTNASTQVHHQLRNSHINQHDYLPNQIYYSKSMQTDDFQVAEPAEEIAVEIEPAKPIFTEAMITETLHASDFQSFVISAGRLVESALSVINVPRETTVSVESGGEISLSRKFPCLGRSITDIDWSFRSPHLLLAAYSKVIATKEIDSSLPDSEGLVIVFSLNTGDRVFTLQSQSPVTCAKFSPFNPSLVVGGTFAGQIVIWDTNSKNIPILKTGISSSHFHPIYSLAIVGTQLAHNIVSASTDGLICSWNMERLNEPLDTIELIPPESQNSDTVAVTCFSFPKNETSAMIVGTELGSIYKVHRNERLARKGGIDSNASLIGHHSVVSGIEFSGTNNLFLSCSFDWTVKLWKNGNTPILLRTFDFEDYVYDISWSPIHPALFAACDGSGKLTIMNILTNERKTHGLAATANKIVWDKEGKFVACGSSNGTLYIYNAGEIITPEHDDLIAMQQLH